MVLSGIMTRTHRATSLATLLVAAAVVSLSGAASAVGTNDPEIAQIEAKAAERSDAQYALLSEWWLRGPRVDADYVGRVREMALAKPYDEEMLRHYVAVASSAKQSDLARMDVQRIVTSEPNNPHGHYALGLLASGDSAAVHFDRALELDSEFAPAFEAKAALALNASPPNLAEAKDLALRSIRQDPSRSSAFSTLAQVYRKSGDGRAEVLAMERSFACDPKNPRTKQGLLMSLQAASKLAEQDSTMAEWTELATSTLDRSGRIGDGDPELLLIAARVWANAKNPAKAEQCLTAAVDAGFADATRIRSDPILAAAIPEDALAPLLARADENRKAFEPELRAALRAERLDLPAPDFELAILNDGRSVKLSDLKGKVVVLDFWATWCGPCRKAIPQIQAFFEQKLPNVETFCVNVFERDGGVKVAPFWKENGYPMPVLLGTEDTAGDYGVRSIPTLFVIGPDGKIRYRHQGFSNDLAEKLRWMAEDAATP